ncbi:MAG: hypothetical protein AAGC68_09575 [Verrucomicrobiota bacterium]
MNSRASPIGERPASRFLGEKHSEKRCRQTVIALLVGISTHLLLFLLLASIHPGSRRAPDWLVVETTVVEPSRSSDPSDKRPLLSPTLPANPPTISILSSDSVSELAIPLAIDGGTFSDWYLPIGIEVPEAFRGEPRQSLFDRSQFGKGETLGVVRDISVSMNRYTESIDRFLSENFPESPQFSSEDSCFVRTQDAVYTIARMAARPGINSVLFVTDLKDRCTEHGVEIVQQALFAKDQPVRFYIITMHQLPKPKLEKLVRESGGETYDYSNDFDLNWRELPSLSNAESSSSAFSPTAIPVGR